MDIEFKRFMDEIETKRRCKESQPRANRRSNEIIQEYVRQHSRGVHNHQQQFKVHQRLYKNVSILQPNNHSKSFIGVPNSHLASTINDNNKKTSSLTRKVKKAEQKRSIERLIQGEPTLNSQAAAISSDEKVRKHRSRHEEKEEKLRQQKMKELKAIKAKNNRIIFERLKKDFMEAVQQVTG